MRLFGFHIGFQPSDQDVSQGDIAVFLAFTVFNMKYFSIEVQIRDLQVPYLEAAKSTPIKQADQYPMLEQVGSLEQSTDFLLTQYYRKLFAVLDGRQFDPLVFHPLDPVGEPKCIDGELEVGIRRCVVFSLDQMQVVVNTVRIYFGGQFIEM
jgi:hypothetical protein